MPEQLKIIIDADVQKAVAGVQNLSKVITSDFVKATNSAAAAASKLSDQVNASVQKINASLSGLKVTSLDIAINTSSIDASIKSIQSKFSALVDPELNVFANTAQAEAKIKELIAELSALKGSDIFIKANDVQALQKINEIEKELNSLVGKQINLNVTTDLTKLNELKSKLDSLKITPINVSANASSIDATIKNIQSKFAAIIDPEINVLANTEAAEVKIKDLLADLSSLRGSEIFIRASDTQALKVINEVETELNSLLDKQIRLNVITTDATQKINLLEKELADLQALTISPNISTQQLSLFEANIKRIKAEIAALKGQGIVIPIQANTAQAQVNINKLSETIETLRAKIEARKSFITVETDITKIAAYNKEIEKLEARMRSIQNVGKNGFELFIVPGQAINSVKNLTNSVQAFGGGVKTFIPPAIAGFTKLAPSITPVITQLKSATASTNAFGKAFGGLRSLAAIIPGIGLGGLIGLAATAVNSLTEGFFEAAFGASKLDKAIDAAGESVNRESLSVITMVRALQSGTLSTEEFRKVKAQVIAQAPEFQKSFDGDKIKIDASEAALKEYVKQLVTTVKVTAALTLVNDVLAKSLSVIAKGGETTAIEKLTTAFGKFNPVAKQLDIKPVDLKLKSLNKALETFQPENITKLIDDTFKKLGITFKDFGKTIDPNALEAALAKQKAAFEKFVNETISKAQQFKKQFGDTFVLPELEVSFFTSKEQVFKNALKVLSDVKFDLRKQAALEKLEIKLPVLFTTETRLDDSDLKKFLRGEITREQVKEVKVTIPVITDFDIQIAQSLAKEFEPTKDLIDNFFKSAQIEKGIPIEVIPDLTLSKSALADIDKKLNLRQQFSIFGDLGLKEFSKIDFSNINEGIAEATKRLQGMMEVATTLNQAIGQGLVNAFNVTFDAILEGKSVFKALEGAVKQLIAGVIKAIAQMLILKAITSLIFPGAGGIVPQIFGSGFAGGGFGQANFGTSGIGSRAFNNVLQVVVNGQISGDTIRLSNQRSTNSAGNYG